MGFKMEWKSIDWVHRDERMDQWLAVLYTVMKIQVKKKRKKERKKSNLQPAETVLAVQTGLCSAHNCHKTLVRGASYIVEIHIVEGQTVGDK